MSTSHEANDLSIYIISDGQIYRNKVQPIIANLRKKIASGKYNAEMAMTLWCYAADDGAKAYFAEFKMSGTWHQVFPVSVRRECAKLLAEHYEDELRFEPNLTA